VRCKQWGWFDCIGDYRISRRKRGLQLYYRLKDALDVLDWFGLDGRISSVEDREWECWSFLNIR
jgi:hypothetical protein